MHTRHNAQPFLPHRITPEFRGILRREPQVGLEGRNLLRDWACQHHTTLLCQTVETKHSHRGANPVTSPANSYSIVFHLCHRGSTSNATIIGRRDVSTIDQFDLILANTLPFHVRRCLHPVSVSSHLLSRREGTLRLRWKRKSRSCCCWSEDRGIRAREASSFNLCRKIISWGVVT